MTVKNLKFISFLTVFMVLATSGGVFSMAKAKSTKAKSVNTEQLATKSDAESDKTGAELAAKSCPWS